MPILLHRVSGFFWTSIPCDEEWYLAIQPCSKIWRMRLTNVAEKPMDAMPPLRTKTTYHVLTGRFMITTDDLDRRIQENTLTERLSCTSPFYLEPKDQEDGVKRLIRKRIDGRHDSVKVPSPLWIERGKAGAPKMNKKLTEKFWHEQWWGGGRRGPTEAVMCIFQKQSDQQS